MVTVSIIIVNWNCSDSIISLLSKFNHQDTDWVEVIVVDNGSFDVEKKKLNDYWSANSKNLKVIFNSSNLGFGVACNLGFKQAKSDLLVFLNPDTLMDVDQLKHSLNIFFEEKCDVLGVQQFNENGILRNCARRPTFTRLFVTTMGLNKLSSMFVGIDMDNWDHKQTRVVDHVMGSFYMIRRSLFEKLNGFDPDYFVYFEDLDLSTRINDLGGKILFTDKVAIYHKGGGASEKNKSFRLFLSLQSRNILARKHLGNLKATLLLILTLTCELCLRILFSLMKGDIDDLKQTLQAYRLLYKKYFSGGF